MLKCLYIVVLVAMCFNKTQGSYIPNTEEVNAGMHDDDLETSKKSTQSRSTTCDCTCGERNELSRIIGGEETGVNEFPWMAKLHPMSCDGALINDRFVITAGHCTPPTKYISNFSVSFGRHDICEKEPVLHQVNKFYRFKHRNFTKDIALVRIDPVELSPTLRPICLPNGDGNQYVGVKAIVAGWGTHSPDILKTSCTLQKVEVPVISNEQCKTYYGPPKKGNNIDDSMLCAGYPETGGKDACLGDSGGPLMSERQDHLYELIGVVSWGIGCGAANYPGVYARVNERVRWIKKKTKDACYCNDGFNT